MIHNQLERSQVTCRYIFNYLVVDMYVNLLKRYVSTVILELLSKLWSSKVVK